MNFKFSKLIPNEEAKAIIETYEKEGYVFRFPECRSEDYQMEEGTEHLTLLASVLAPNMTPVYLPKEWFKKKEPLKPYVWYPVEEFDGNPNNYILLEMDDNGLCYLYNFESNRLSEYRTHFMYIERLKEILDE